MIITKDINPKRDLYYIGAMIIKILSDSDKNHDFLSVFQSLKQSENISMNLFVLTLDWLFIIGVISKIKEGYIIKCF